MRAFVKVGKKHNYLSEDEVLIFMRKYIRFKTEKMFHEKSREETERILRENKISKSTYYNLTSGTLSFTPFIQLLEYFEKEKLGN